MWNLTPESLQSAKEELKGREAAIRAHLATELGTLEADIEEINTLERLAYAFAAKRLSDGEVASEAEPETIALLQRAPIEEAILGVSPAALAAEHLADSEAIAVESELTVVFDDAAVCETAAAEVFPQPTGRKGAGSRWRMRIESDAEAS